MQYAWMVLAAAVVVLSTGCSEDELLDLPPGVVLNEFGILVDTNPTTYCGMPGSGGTWCTATDCYDIWCRTLDDGVAPRCNPAADEFYRVCPSGDIIWPCNHDHAPPPMTDAIGRECEVHGLSPWESPRLAEWWLQTYPSMTVPGPGPGTLP